MITLLGLIFPSLLIGANSFMVGQLYYDGKWELETSSGSGSNLLLGPIMNASSFDQLLFTYNQSIQNFSNITQTLTQLSACVFSGAKTLTAQNLYQTLNTVGTIGFQALSTQNVIFFQETQNSSTDLMAIFTSKLTAQKIGSSHTVFSLNSSSITSIQAAGSGDNAIFNLLTSSNELLNKLGTVRGFPYNNSIPAGVNSSVLQFVTTHVAQNVLTAYSQTVFGIPSVAYLTQSATQISSPTILTDNTETGVNFLGFNPQSTYLFFADTSQVGTRLAASKILSTGRLAPPIYLVSPYTYQNTMGFSIFDKEDKVFIVWYGSNLVYLAEFNTTSNTWEGLFSGPSALGATTLPQVVKNTPYLFFSTSQSAPWGYNVNSYLFNLASNNFSTSSGGTPTQLNVYPSQTTTSGSAIAGTVAYFFSPALIDSSKDSRGDDITIFTGALGGITQIAYNVYDSTKNVYSGLKSILSGSTTSLGTPTIISKGTLTAAVWPVNLNGSYSIWGAVYNPITQTFSQGQALIQGFVSMPQIVESPSGNGVIFGGSM